MPVTRIITVTTAALHRLILACEYVTLLDERVENGYDELSELEAA